MTVTKQQCKTFETPKTVTESKEECVDVTTDVCIKVPVPNCVTEHEKVVSEVTALYHRKLQLIATFLYFSSIGFVLLCLQSLSRGHEVQFSNNFF